MLSDNVLSGFLALGVWQSGPESLYAILRTGNEALYLTKAGCITKA